jgi:hypothetical protein
MRVHIATDNLLKKTDNFLKAARQLRELIAQCAHASISIRNRVGADDRIAQIGIIATMEHDHEFPDFRLAGGTLRSAF